MDLYSRKLCKNDENLVLPNSGDQMSMYLCVSDIEREVREAGR